MRKLKKQGLALALCLSMLLPALPVMAAGEDGPAAADGLCVHHQEHTEECGYTETAGSPCAHVHDENCGYAAATEGSPCAHIHDEACGYVEAAEEIPCNMGCTDTDGDGSIDHAEGCAYRPAAEGQTCAHAHDEACGYAAATEGSPCTHTHDGTCGYVEAVAAPCSYAVSGCPFCVASWDWADEDGPLTRAEDGGWGLGLPGVSEDAPLTRGELEALLPGRIAAVTGTGESVGLDIIWDLSAIGEAGVSAGTYALTASLAETEENYALSKDAAELAVTVELGGAQPLADGGLPLPTGSISQAPLQERLVQGISPNGTTINLFDYWIDGRTNRDDKNYGDYGDEFFKSGINNGHALLFGRAMGSQANDTTKTNLGIWNDWTTSVAPRQGIVKGTLGDDGYPVLNVDMKLASNPKITEMEPNESLAYLFDPDEIYDSERRESYTDVQGLLQVDEEGYYYYNSQLNYAVYYPDDNAFALYNLPGIKPDGGSPVGQFFPLNEANDTTGKVDKNGKTYDVVNTTNSKNASINHYFGLHMSTRFIHKYGGHVDGSEDANEVTYEFSGDDDVWIFIDGVLVADLGGIHDAASVEINFATGKIVINGDKEAKYKKESTLQKAFEDAGKENALKWETYIDDVTGEKYTTFADNTFHTLDFFYLERGNTDSNMYLRYNLQPIPESEISKIDQEANAIPGVEFKLYVAEKNEDTGNYTIAKKANGTESDPIWSGTTKENGEIILEDAKGTTLAWGELAQDYNTNHFILKEVGIPEGYHSYRDETWLEYDPDVGVVMSDNYWYTGNYGEPQVTITATNKLYEGEGGSGNKGKELVDLKDRNKIDPSNPSTVPKVYAVVFKRVNAAGEGSVDEQLKGSTWLPISGSVTAGWKIHGDVGDDSDKMFENIRRAIENNIAVGNQATFEFQQDGSFRCTMTELPGSLEFYYQYKRLKYNALVEKYKEEGKNDGEAAALAAEEVKFAEAAYAVNYYYRDRNGDLVRLYSDEFGRDFSTHLYISNIKNYLVVQKLDEDDTPLNGAKFALFKAGEGPTYDNTDIRHYIDFDDHLAVNYEEFDAALQNNTIAPVDTGTTETLEYGEPRGENGEIWYKVASPGMILFPGASGSSDNKRFILEQGTYYLVEAKAPEGYERNGYAAKIVVNERGVFPYAGDEGVDDGITTTRYVASAIKSMLRFVEDNGVDATLNRIKIQLATAEGREFPASDEAWDAEWNENAELGDADELHLYYAGRAKTSRGVEYDAESPDKQQAALGNPVESGWSKLMIRQCRDHYKGFGGTGGNAPSGSYYTEKLSRVQDLKDTDITRLFSRLAAVRVTNKPVTTDEKEGGLTVTKTVTGSGDKNKEFHFTVTLNDKTVNGTYGGMTFTNGVADFTLKHNESKTATGLPAGITYTVAEAEANQDGYTTTASGASGTTPAGGTAKAEFVNDKGTPPPGPGDDTTSLTVKKEWKLDDGGTKAESVTAQLLRNGSAYGGPVTLDDSNRWTHTWTGLDDRYNWSVREVDVPNGFTATVAQSGTTWTINNDDTPPDNPPDDPPDTPPDDPPDDPPDEPETPSEPDKPDKPDQPEDVGNPDIPKGGAEPDPDVPETGDHSHLLLWLTLMVLSGTGLVTMLILAWRARYRGERLKK
ncbi:Cna B-type domain-containing protein [Flavonifractor sp. An100]|uniref:DUF7601 domain-containing protein n=1 Tax=Flavonifractor sp. An100 TaxID=1965538 RepID=UPI001302CC43|nr:Cna B-type domain-containing protein [Flavonifractor sp. An100]